MTFGFGDYALWGFADAKKNPGSQTGIFYC